MTEQAPDKKIESYRCPACGAPLFFDTERQRLRCGACGNAYTREALRQSAETNKTDETKEKPFGQAKASGVSPEIPVDADSEYDWDAYTPRKFDAASDGAALSGYVCPSCGAEVTGDANLGATVCPYCGNAVIVKKQFSDTYRPDYVIPFRIDKKEASALFEKACAKAPFLPNEFTSRRKIEEMTGLYVPFFTFDAACSGSADYHAKRIRTWNDSRYYYTQTDTYRVSRSGTLDFRNVPVDCSAKIDNTYMEALEPFDYAAAQTFDTSYLAGFVAEKYSVPASECAPRAKERMQASMLHALDETVSGYSECRRTGGSVRCRNGKIRYALLPVFMLHVNYEGKSYRYAINGQTGKLIGIFPTDPRKRRRYFAKMLGISFLGFTALFALIGIFFFGGGIG